MKTFIFPIQSFLGCNRENELVDDDEKEEEEEEEEASILSVALMTFLSSNAFSFCFDQAKQMIVSCIVRLFLSLFTGSRNSM